MAEINYFFVLGAALLAVASPGPATLTIAGIAIGSGRKPALALACGVLTGSFMWSIAAAAGMSAVMLAQVWLLEIIRYAGAGYLAWLGIKSARSALTASAKMVEMRREQRLGSAYAKGLALHLTNPKAILFLGSIYAIGLPAGVTPVQLLTVIMAIGIQSGIVFLGYAMLFSSAPLARAYVRARRGFEAVFAVFFGVAAFKILTARLA